MFLKKRLIKSSGKSHLYWELTESYRTAKGPRQRPVAYLGELEEIDLGGWDRLAKQLDGKRLPIIPPMLFCPEADPEPVPAQVTVELDGVRVDATKDFGDVWLGMLLWSTLGFDKLFGSILPDGHEGVSWDLVATILVLARFCEPSSELHIENTWYPRTALPEMLGVPREQVYVQRLYRGLDKLVDTKTAVEKHLRGRMGELFKVEYDLLLYDVTSSYFEGAAEANPQAKYGHSRDKRSDCKQICIALIVSTDGLPLAYEVFDGNRADMTTVEEIVRSVEAKYGAARRVWVLDRGMVNEENLEFIRQRGGSYLVGTPRSMLRQYERELTESGWTAVYEDLEVKLAASPSGSETFVLCRSTSRAEKEKAMHERFSKRIEDGLATLARRLATTRHRPDRTRIGMQIGRLMGKNSRAAGKYEVTLIDDPHRPGHLRLQWRCRPEWTDWAILSEGAYLLRTDLTGRKPEELWKTYMQLTDAEAAIRTLKSELCLRPMFHQTQRRIHAHVLVAFIAYAMTKTLQKWMENSGLGRGFRTVVEEFARIKCCEVVLPTSTGRQLQLRCITKPDEHQRILLKRLGAAIPSRLGRPQWRKMIETGAKCSANF